MPRRPLHTTDRFPYHVTTRSNNREWFYIPNSEVWEILVEKIGDNTELFGTVFHAIVLMSNHLHLVLSTPRANIGDAARHLFTVVSKAIQRRAQRINHVFGGRYRWSVLDDAASVAYVYKYVLRNPVRASLTEHVNEYPFSSASPTNKFVQITDGIGPLWKYVPRDFEERLHWLNRPVQKDLEIWISKGLRRETFRFSQGNDARKAIESLQMQYSIDRDTQTA